jgi:hypothetical protein
MKFVRAFVIASTLLLASGMLAQTPVYPKNLVAFDF